MRILLIVLIPLVFFGAGMIFANLLWGRYRQLYNAIREQLKESKKAEQDLRESLQTLSSRHSEQAATCRTLEEEIASVASERERLLAMVERADADAARLQRIEQEAFALNEKYETQKLKLQTESISHQDALKAAENRARQIEQERDELLALVGKLQGKLDHIAPLQRQLLDTEGEVKELRDNARRERLRNRRVARRNGGDDLKRSRNRSARQPPKRFPAAPASIERAPEKPEASASIPKASSFCHGQRQTTEITRTRAPFTPARAPESP